MKKSEKVAFEKWIEKRYGAIWDEVFLPEETELLVEAFLAGYRAGFEAQHYDIDDVSKGKVDHGSENKG